VPWNVHEFFPGVLDFTGKTHPVLPNDHHLDPFEYSDSIGTGGPHYYDLGLKVNTNLESFLGLCKAAGARSAAQRGQRLVGRDKSTALFQP
jgi:hypothetical protein